MGTNFYILNSTFVIDAKDVIVINYKAILIKAH